LLIGGHFVGDKAEMESLNNVIVIDGVAKVIEHHRRTSTELLGMKMNLKDISNYFIRSFHLASCGHKALALLGIPQPTTAIFVVPFFNVLQHHANIVYYTRLTLDAIKINKNEAKRKNLDAQSCRIISVGSLYPTSSDYIIHIVLPISSRCHSTSAAEFKNKSRRIRHIIEEL
jgi:hypothetical protein